MQKKISGPSRDNSNRKVNLEIHTPSASHRNSMKVHDLATQLQAFDMYMHLKGKQITTSRLFKAEPVKTNSSAQKKQLMKDSMSVETERQSNSMLRSQDEQQSSMARNSKATEGLSSGNMMAARKISKQQSKFKNDLAAHLSSTSSA